MRIAVLASNFIRIPPTPRYVPQGRSGATEKVVYSITEGLVRRGHRVTLFASGDSKTSAELVSVTSISSVKDKNIGFNLHEVYEYLLISKAYQMAKKRKFDIIHSHFDIKTAYFAPFVNTPTVSTLHSPLNKVSDILKHFSKTQYYISISDYQRKPISSLNYIDTIYHGLDLSAYPFDEVGDDYLLYIGRIAPQKGTDLAIRVARYVQRKLIICGWARKIYMKYYNDEVKPFIDSRNIQLFGFLSRRSLKKIIKKAKFLLFPIKWEEPFGLVMIEAMACGTPVIAFAKGSVPEVIADGKTGYIVNSSDEDIRGNWIIKKSGLAGLIEAVKKINFMDRREYVRMRLACRKHVEENFTSERMVEDYEKVYKQILNIKYQIF